MLKNALWLFAVTSIILFVFLPSYSRLQDLRQKNAEYAHEVKRLTVDNNLLAQEIMRLEHDPIYLEKVARDKMGLIREGEVVYKITPAVLNKTLPPAATDPNKTLPKEQKK